MSDSAFAVVMCLGYGAVCAVAGAFAMWVALSGPHECAVKLQHTDHVAVYITECKI